MSTRRWLVGLTFAGLLAACGDNSGTTPSTTTATTVAATGGISSEPCSLLTTADVQSLAGVTPHGAGVTTVSPDPKGMSCVWAGSLNNQSWQATVRVKLNATSDSDFVSLPTGSKGFADATVKGSPAKVQLVDFGNNSGGSGEIDVHPKADLLFAVTATNKNGVTSAALVAAAGNVSDRWRFG